MDTVFDALALNGSVVTLVGLYVVRSVPTFANTRATRAVFRFFFFVFVVPFILNCCKAEAVTPVPRYFRVLITK